MPLIENETAWWIIGRCLFSSFCFFDYVNYIKYVNHANYGNDVNYVSLTISGRKYAYEVFISHAWKGDSGPASKTVKAFLEENGLRVWYDEKDMEDDINEVWYKRGMESWL